LENGVFSTKELLEIRAAIRDKYRKVSQAAEGLFKYQTGKSGAIALGYDSDIINKYPEKTLRSFCGVGNPFSISKIDSGSSVLDIGCGAGFDILVAGEIVGAKGHVCGIDLSEEMIQQAQALIEQYGDQSISVKHVASESIPYDDEAFDYVMSNGVFNLSPLKAELFREIFRVLKPGGTLQFADIVLVEEGTPDAVINLEAWAQ